MKQLALLTIPKTAPSHHDRLQAFKKQHGIWTHKDYSGFTAMLYERAIQQLNGYLSADDPQEPMDLIAGYCRLLDEANLLVHGNGELSAIRLLCALNNIPCDL